MCDERGEGFGFVGLGCDTTPRCVPCLLGSVTKGRGGGVDVIIDERVCRVVATIPSIKSFRSFTEVTSRGA